MFRGPLRRPGLNAERLRLHLPRISVEFRAIRSNLHPWKLN